jgi:hypothetical protein
MDSDEIQSTDPLVLFKSAIEIADKRMYQDKEARKMARD